MWWLREPLKFCIKIELLLILLVVLFSVFIKWLFELIVVFAADWVSDAAVVRVSGIFKWFKLESLATEVTLFWNKVNMLFVCWWLCMDKRLFCDWVEDRGGEVSDKFNCWLLILFELANSLWSRKSWSIFLLVVFLGFLFVVAVIGWDSCWYRYVLGNDCWSSFEIDDFLDDLDVATGIDVDFFRFDVWFVFLTFINLSNQSNMFTSFN